MKDYNKMAESILRRRDAHVAARKKQRKTRFVSLSCFCLCVVIGVGVWKYSSQAPVDAASHTDNILPEQGEGLQTPVEDGIPPEQGGNTLPSVEVEDSSGTVQLEHGTPAMENFDTEDPAELPEVSADATPLAPPTTALTQEELYDAAGAYLPVAAPKGFIFEGAAKSEYGYTVIWSNGMEYLDWHIREYQQEDAGRITSVADTENYDLSLYPIPRAESVPDALRQIVNDPIFLLEELTQEAVNARAYRVSDAGDSAGDRMRFSVLCGDTLISVTSKGVSPQWLYGQFSSLAE